MLVDFDSLIDYTSSLCSRWNVSVEIKESGYLSTVVQQCK